MLISASQSLLLVVDLQQKLLPVIHGGDAIVGQAVRMARIAHLLEVPVIGTEQLPDKLGLNHEDIRPLCHKVVSKQHFDACAGGLTDALPLARREIVIAGCETHICVLQTALSLLEGGYRVLPLLDACGSRQPADRDAAFARLRQAGAEPVTVEMVAYEWMRESAHPRFRDVLKLIK